MGLEIAGVVEGWGTGMVQPYWKYQWGKGLRIDGVEGWEGAAFFGAQGYRLTRYGRQLLGLVAAAGGGGP